MDLMIVAALALLIENLIGYPKSLYAQIGHPVEWMGKLISHLEQTLNRPADQSRQQRLAGVLAVVILCVALCVPAVLIQWFTSFFSFGWVINALLATTLIAQKSLRDHVVAVEDALGSSLVHARTEVAKIVGRDTSTLNQSDIAKAALESLAENTSDGVVAPALWFAVAGLPGLVFYKAINTADSMIGHRSERYLYFGWAAARLDDLINLPASRVSGLLFAAGSAVSSLQNAKHALKTMWRDASKHGSPNAGWPEAAMAGALGVRFGGPRNYEGQTTDLPWMGDGRTEVTKSDIVSGLDLFERATLILAAALFCLGVIL